MEGGIVSKRILVIGIFCLLATTILSGCTNNQKNEIKDFQDTEYIISRVDNVNKR